MALRLPKAFVQEMVAHALAEAPNECCGIIAGADGQAVKLYRCRNAEQSPYRYQVDSQDLFRAYRECQEKGWDFLAIYHSHTASEAYPSPTDVRLAFWPEAYYVLISLKDPGSPVVRAFRILDGQVTEEEIVMEGEEEEREDLVRLARLLGLEPVPEHLESLVEDFRRVRRGLERLSALELGETGPAGAFRPPREEGP
jgi:proteasome lid subunit RPN8/RPN11